MCPKTDLIKLFKGVTTLMTTLTVKVRSMENPKTSEKTTVIVRALMKLLTVFLWAPLGSTVG